MKIRILLLSLLMLVSATAFAQQGGITGKVVSRDGRVALNNVKVVVEPSGVVVTTDAEGRFTLENLPKGDYKVSFEAPDFETQTLAVRVDKMVKDVRSVILAADVVRQNIDDSVFAEFDTETASDATSLPSSLSASKDVFNSIASYKFSEMRFNVRGYDSQYSDIYLNGIQFNDALTGYGPWSLWSGLNDATRNQENYAGLAASDFGVGGIGGMTNINARASQMRKGFRASAVNGNSMYRFRLMLSYASGALDNGWSYGFSFSTRQGGNSYVDGVYYNSYAYFGSVEKQFGARKNHRLGLTFMASPTERGAQQASTDEAYELFGDNYYNPNVGYQNGKMRNARVRNTHEPIAMLTYSWDITERTRLTAATSLRFGSNGYSALTWKEGSDPRPDYYRYLPSYQLFRMSQGEPSADGSLTVSGDTYLNNALEAAQSWTGRMDWDRFYQVNGQTTPHGIEEMFAGEGTHFSNTMVEERHTDQLDYNFVANISHTFRNNSKLVGGLKARINRTEYYDEVKDLLGGDYWLDVDKFAQRDFGSDVVAYQNDLAYYEKFGHAKMAKEGDKISYDYYANLRAAQLWASYGISFGNFSMNIGGEAGYTQQWREGRWRKGLFPNDSYGNSEKLDFFTYRAKLNLAYQFSGAHSVSAAVTMIQDAPKFQSSFVAARTRNHTTPGLTTEKILGAELTYNLNLPFIKARLSGYYSEINDQSKVISFYDDVESSFTNFAMSNMDQRYYGVELGVQVPIWNGISFNGAVSWGNYRYTSNPNFTQIVDNSADVRLQDKVYWKNSHVEGTPEFAANVGLNYRGPHSWFASIDLNIYSGNYLSMNPFYRTGAAVKPFIFNDGGEADLLAIDAIRHEEKFDTSYVLNASVGKNWSIQRKYTIGFSLEVKNLINNQDMRSGGYEQMRMYKSRNQSGKTFYTRFPSKYFYLLGTTYYLNVYFRF
ncbi:MAG: TonB-dependent receptor [Alistipes sp.]